MGLDDTLAYTVPQNVRLRDWRLGALNYFIKASIVVYIIFSILTGKALRTDTPEAQYSIDASSWAPSCFLAGNYTTGQCLSSAGYLCLRGKPGTVRLDEATVKRCSGLVNEVGVVMPTREAMLRFLDCPGFTPGRRFFFDSEGRLAGNVTSGKATSNVGAADPGSQIELRFEDWYLCPNLAAAELAISVGERGVFLKYFTRHILSYYTDDQTLPQGILRDIERNRQRPVSDIRGELSFYEVFEDTSKLNIVLSFGVEGVNASNVAVTVMACPENQERCSNATQVQTTPAGDAAVSLRLPTYEVLLRSGVALKPCLAANTCKVVIDLQLRNDLWSAWLRNAKHGGKIWPSYGQYGDVFADIHIRGAEVLTDVRSDEEMLNGHISHSQIVKGVHLSFQVTGTLHCFSWTLLLVYVGGMVSLLAISGTVVSYVATSSWCCGHRSHFYRSYMELVSPDINFVENDFAKQKFSGDHERAVKELATERVKQQLTVGMEELVRTKSEPMLLAGLRAAAAGPRPEYSETTEKLPASNQCAGERLDLGP